MNSIIRDRALPVAVVALCVWQAADLVVARRHSPLDRLGWLGRDLPAGAITLLRLMLPVLGSGWWFLGLRKVQGA